MFHLGYFDDWSNILDKEDSKKEESKEPHKMVSVREDITWHKSLCWQQQFGCFCAYAYYYKG